jgi:hypothetical protein
MIQHPSIILKSKVSSIRYMTDIVTMNRRKKVTVDHNNSKMKKSSGRNSKKAELPELLPCLIDINPPNPKRVYNTPNTAKKTLRFRARKYSFTDSRLSENNHPGQISGFKKRLFSQPPSFSKLSKVQNPPRHAKYIPHQRVIVPLNRIVHERCYNQYLFPNKTLWKYLNSTERIENSSKLVKVKSHK